MSIIYNGTNIENITYNGNEIDTVNYNNTEVYVSTRTLTVNIGDYISSIIINGTTYTSNTTVNIKPGTTATLSCNLNNSSTSGNFTYTYSFVNWTGYTTNTNKSFTFTMPNENITYTSNGQIESQTFNWPSSGNINESTFLAGIDAGSYNTSLVGRTVTLTESSSTHNWIIVRVNSKNYDLWYNGSIGEGRWTGSGTDRYWTNNGTNNTDYVRGLCTSYKSKLSSSIQAKLKTGLNKNCGSDTIVILSSNQLRNTNTNYTNDNNGLIMYFNNNDRRKIGSVYWTSSAYSGNSYSIWCVASDGTFTTYYSTTRYSVVPAIRVG